MTKAPSRPSQSNEIEEGVSFTPKFDASDLIAAIVVDASDNNVLMFAYMNRDALKATLQTGFVHFWSRSRQKLWQKGESSGETLKVTSISTDCDQDSLLIVAHPQGLGATCHTGRRSCFYRTIEGIGSAPSHCSLSMSDDIPLFDPDKVYRK